MRRSLPLSLVMVFALAIGAAPAMAHVVDRVSVSSTGEPSNGDLYSPMLSGDGRYVAFTTWEFDPTNLIPDDTNDYNDVLVHDRYTGETKRVSVSSTGVPADGWAWCDDISYDGRLVLFDSVAMNLVPGTPQWVNFFVHDCVTGSNELLPRPPDQGYNSRAWGGAMTPDGRYVAMANFVWGNGDYSGDPIHSGSILGYFVVSIYDRASHTLTECFRHVEPSGDYQWGYDYYFDTDIDVSADGRFVACNMIGITGDRRTEQLYVYDRQTSVLDRVSVSPEGNCGDSLSFLGSISDDGRFVAFMSGADNLVYGDSNQHDDVFVRDLQTRQTERVSVSSSGEQGNGMSWYGASISADGRYVAFASEATNLVAGDTNGTDDVFVRDRQTGETIRASVDAAGMESPYGSLGGYVSGNGEFVLFESSPDAFLPGGSGGYYSQLYVARNIKGPNPPSRPTVDVTPDNPKTEDDLTCSITVPSVDPDGDPVTYRYRWYKDDVHQPPFDDLDVVPASATAKGETWKCVVTPNDGTSDGWSGQDSVTLANAAPTQPTIDVTPNSPKPEDDLTCTITKPSTDPDGDTVTYRYRWYKGGVAQGDYDDQTTVPASATARGDIWKCVVTPTDGTDDGPSDEDQVAVDAPFLEWAGTPGYESDGVDPDIGNPQGASSPTTFTFKVKYTDPSGRPPQVRRCWIRKLADEGGWEACKTPNMTLESGTIETGAIYSCSVELPNETMKYCFGFRDADGAPVEGPPTVYGDGPLIIGRPKVIWSLRESYIEDGVDPDSGPLGTKFWFQVQYRDAAGDYPITYELLIRRNGILCYRKVLAAGSSGDFRLGRIYRTSVILNQPGLYEYRFHMADASGNALGPPNNWHAGPTITDGSSGAAVTSLAAVPTARGAQITFNLSSATNVTATVVNVAGRPIRTIVADKPLEAGVQTLLWDRRAESGLAVPSGLYLVRVTARADDGSQSSALTTVSLR